MNVAFFSLHLARERGCRSYDPPSTSPLHQFQVKDNKTTTLYTCECPKVSIVIYQREKKAYDLNQQFLVKKHELSLNIGISSLSHMHQSSLKAFHEQFK